MRRAIVLISWAVLSIISLSVSSFMVESPAIMPIIFIICVSAVILGTSFLVYFLGQAMSARQQSDVMSDAVFAQSTDGLLCGHISNLQVLRANKSAERLFETQDWAVLVRLYPTKLFFSLSR